jgi:hypothetical protein
MKNKNYLYMGIAIFLILFALVLVVNTEDTTTNEEQRVYCTEDQRDVEVCTMEYAPVCGYHEDGSYETYGNVCEACKNSEIIYWIQGEC